MQRARPELAVAHCPLQLRRQSDGALLPRVAISAAAGPGRRAHLRLPRQRRLRRAKLSLHGARPASIAPISAAPFPTLRCAIRGFCSPEWRTCSRSAARSGSMSRTCSATCSFWAWAPSGWRNCWRAPACIRCSPCCMSRFRWPSFRWIACWWIWPRRRWRSASRCTSIRIRTALEALPDRGRRRALPRNRLPAVRRLRHPPAVLRRYRQIAIFATALLPAVLWTLWVRRAIPGGAALGPRSLFPLWGMLQAVLHPRHYAFSAPVVVVIRTLWWVQLGGIVLSIVLAFAQPAQAGRGRDAQRLLPVGVFRDHAPARSL